ncbi:Auxin-responsive protein IAA14 [Zea mays]|uniref:Auxin-responsive protein IAA14 n=1 Tax=Zea mays TaxID=4577 RepID=A0A1D6MVX2_MAIZE|nr:Auxin-responsive protein IAA14 [Zea mays]
MQAPSDHERIRSHWPGAKGHGEMQEQKLRRRRTDGSLHLSTTRGGWMQEEQISMAFAALLVSVSYSSSLPFRPLYLPDQ